MRIYRVLGGQHFLASATSVFSPYIFFSLLCRSQTKPNEIVRDHFQKVMITCVMLHTKGFSEQITELGARSKSLSYFFNPLHGIVLARTKGFTQSFSLNI